VIVSSNARARDRTAVWLFVLALLVRVLYLGFARAPHETYSWRLADGLLRDGSLVIGGAKTSAYEPLYPVFLAIARRLTGDRMMLVRTVQSALGAFGAVLLYRLAAALAGRARVGLIAAGLYALYPLLIRYAVDFSDATLTAVLMLGFVAAFISASTLARAAVAGVWLGLMMLTRMMTLPLLAIGAMLLWRDRGWRPAAAFTITALLVVAPLAIRNHTVGGSMWPTRSGVNLFISNCDYTPRILPKYGPDILEDYAASVLRRRARVDVDVPSSPAVERVLDAEYTRLAIEHIAAHPGAILRLKLRNLWYFFSPSLVPTLDPTAPLEFEPRAGGGFTIANSRPRPLVDRAIYTASYTPVCVAALAGIWLRRRRLRHDAILWAAVITFAVVHAIYFPTTRYRVPVEFVLLFYAAVAIEAWMRQRPDGHGHVASMTSAPADAGGVSSDRNGGSDTNHPAKAVLGFVPSTGVTWCSTCSAIRNRMASPRTVLGASIVIVSDRRSRSWKTPPR
jgi:4-amino-4-deoxy-L-arabinose transferase-like glycosyltransferase